MSPENDDDCLSGLGLLSGLGGKRRKETWRCWSSYTWPWVDLVVMEVEENAPFTRGESNGNPRPTVRPSCSLHPLAWVPSLLLYSPSIISN